MSVLSCALIIYTYYIMCKIHNAERISSTIFVAVAGLKRGNLDILKSMVSV